MGNWTKLPTLLAKDDIRHSGKVIINETSASTTPLSQLNGKYRAQAIVRIQPDWFQPGQGIGDLYSEVKEIEFKKNDKQTFTFTANNAVEKPQFRHKGPIQDHFLKSNLLSKFHKRNYLLRYSVILPESWDKTKKYPVIYYITGFTGVHHTSTARIKKLFGDKGKQLIIVIPDANCRWGHSVFANSTTTGPWADALIKEIIPHIDKTYGGAGPEHRYITGLSSGGWASAWAIINNPDAFSQSWPVAPDPVDFRMFQEINLVDNKPDNLYLTTEKEKHLERLISIPSIKIPFSNMAKYENVIGPGGQLQSFAAVFSPALTPDGSYQQYYNHKTGEINMAVTKQWKPFCISRKLEAEWNTIGTKLKGKLHFAIQQKDLFHLDHSMRLLESKCKQLGSNAIFTYFHKTGHYYPEKHAHKLINSALKKWTNSQHSKKTKEPYYPN